MTSGSRRTTCGCCTAKFQKRRTRAVEQYLMLVIDHGFNASTFTARVIASTGADLAAASVAQSARCPGRCMAERQAARSTCSTRSAIRSRTESVRPRLVEAGDRVMGFGHRVYKTDDPRSRFLRDLAEQMDAPLLDFASDVETLRRGTLAELKPGRELHANVEFYAGVVMDACGHQPRDVHPDVRDGPRRRLVRTRPRTGQHNRLIRPSARYVGPPAPQPVPSS